MRHHLSILAFCLCLCFASHAQDSITKKTQRPRWTDSVFHLFSQLDSLKSINPSKYNLDSVAKSKFSKVIQFPDTAGFARMLKNAVKPPVIFKSKPFLSFNGGYINYNWNFTTGIDTPFVEKNISQHLVSSTLNFTVAQKIPIRVTYFERKSNSIVFRDFRDVRVEFDANAYRQLQAQRMYQYFNNMIDRMRDPFTKPAMNISLDKLNQLRALLAQKDMVNKLLDARKKLIKSFNDSVHFHSDDEVRAAREFIAFYDRLTKTQKKYENLYDSLQKEWITKEGEIKALRKLLQGNPADPEHIESLKKALVRSGMKDKRMKKLLDNLYAVRTFAIGKTLPSFSPLTVKNVNVNGINFEYNKNHFYFAATAGAVDYRVRDFVYRNQRRVPQFVYAGRIGYGLKERNNIILTYFQGKKQVLGGSLAATAVTISGVSLATQLALMKHLWFNGEIAQSSSPATISIPVSNEKSGFDFKDKSNRAYSLQLRMNLPKAGTRIDGSFQHKGLNFQNFSDYRVNAVSNSWSAKMDQYLFKRTLHISAAARKNDFSNPLVLQRYDANTVYESFSVTYRKRNWPVLTIGYIPSSQYTVIDSQVYENHYQVLNANAFYQYKIYNTRMSSVAMYNRFYNNSRDTGFLYYNANNYYFNQTVYFSQYTANFGFNHTEGSTYKLDVLDAGFTTKFFKKYTVGFGVKVNHTFVDGSKVGVYANGGFTIPLVGELSFWLEKNYLPGWQQGLVKNEFYSIGFTRYLK